jgi:cytochrome P450
MAVRKELANKLNGNPPTLEQLNDLPQLEAALKESMRLLPPINWFSRRATAATQLGSYHIPKGATVICSPFVTHREPKLYPQPNKFLPERWHTLNSTRRRSSSVCRLSLCDVQNEIGAGYHLATLWSQTATERSN